MVRGDWPRPSKIVYIALLSKDSLRSFCKRSILSRIRPVCHVNAHAVTLAEKKKAKGGMKLTAVTMTTPKLNNTAVDENRWLTDKTNAFLTSSNSFHG